MGGGRFPSSSRGEKWSFHVGGRRAIIGRKGESSPNKGVESGIGGVIKGHAPGEAGHRTSILGTRESGRERGGLTSNDAHY